MFLIFIFLSIIFLILLFCTYFNNAEKYFLEALKYICYRGRSTLLKWMISKSRFQGEVGVPCHNKGRRGCRKACSVTEGVFGEYRQWLRMENIHLTMGQLNEESLGSYWNESSVILPKFHILSAIRFLTEAGGEVEIWVKVAQRSKN